MTLLFNIFNIIIIYFIFTLPFQHSSQESFLEYQMGFPQILKPF